MTAARICPQCGSEILTAEATASGGTFCPGCHPPQERPSSFQKVFRPGPHYNLQHEDPTHQLERQALALEMVATACGLVGLLALLLLPRAGANRGVNFLSNEVARLLGYLLAGNWWVMVLMARGLAARSSSGWTRAAVLGSAVAWSLTGVALLVRPPGAFTPADDHAARQLWLLLIAADAVSAELLYVLYLRAIALRLGSKRLAMRLIIYFGSVCVGAGAVFFLAAAATSASGNERLTASLVGLSLGLRVLFACWALCWRTVLLNHVRHGIGFPPVESRGGLDDGPGGPPE
jgi:hypothetical protein